MTDNDDALPPEHDEGEITAKGMFQKNSKVAVLMCYDMIDKLRYWEKETLELQEDQIGERSEQLVGFVEQLRAAYLDLPELGG